MDITFDMATNIGGLKRSMGGSNRFKGILTVSPIRNLEFFWSVIRSDMRRHIRPGRLRSLVYHGSKRKDVVPEIDSCDVVLTTYDTLRSDWATNGPLYKGTWVRIMLDEGEYIPANNLLRPPLSLDKS